jgi:hypothetical protein
MSSITGMLFQLFVNITLGKNIEVVAFPYYENKQIPPISTKRKIT